MNKYFMFFIFCLLTMFLSCNLSKYTVDNKIIMPKEAKEKGAKFNNFFDDFWTKKESTITNLTYEIEENDKYIIVNTKGWSLLKNDFSKMGLHLYVNNKEQKFVFKNNESYYFDLNKDIKTIKSLKFKANTFNPASMGKNKDNRDLGLDIQSIVIAPVIIVKDRKIDIQNDANRGLILENFWDNVWTRGEGIIKNFSYKVQESDQYLILGMKGWNLIMNDMSKLGLKIYTNDKELAFAFKSENFFYFKLEKGISEINQIKIVSNTFNPKVMGKSTDDRNLGIDVISIMFAGTYVIDDKILNIKTALQNGAIFENILSDGWWTTGNSTIKNIKIKVDKTDSLFVLGTNGWHIVKNINYNKTLRVFVNNIELKFYSKSLNNYYFKIQSISEINEIKIVTNVYNPKNEGINKEDRIIGIDLNEVRLIGTYKVNGSSFLLDDGIKNELILENFLDNAWTSDYGIIKNISFLIPDNSKYFIIETKGWNLIKDDFNKLGLKVFINNTELNYLKTENNSFHFALDKSVKEITDIKISSNTFNPKLMGKNNDNRNLGIDVNSIIIQ